MVLASAAVLMVHADRPRSCLPILPHVRAGRGARHWEKVAFWPLVRCPGTLAGDSELKWEAAA